MKKKIIIIFLIVLVVGLIAVYKNTTTKFGKNLTAQAIDTTAPVVSITTPLDGQVVSGSNVTVCVQATDASGIAVCFDIEF
jgi:flagellar basal body-associated protein FliL